MNERVHDILDEAAGASDPTSPDAEEIEALSGAVSLAAGHVLSVAVPDLEAAIMTALPQPEPKPSPLATLKATLVRVAELLLQPRQIAIRPAYGLLFGACLLWFGVRGVEPPLPPLAEAEAPAVLYVQFRIDAPGASNVAVAGSFTDWQPDQALREVSPGVWVAMVPLAPGVHDYLFVVDEESWVPDPAARPVDDGFGGVNSRLFLVSPGAAT
jgi:hypothetical protein